MVRLFSAAIFGLLSLSGFSQAAAVSRAEASVQVASSFPGKLEVVSSNPPKFRYSTSQPNDKNWIGIYDAAGGGPDAQRLKDPSIKWDWAPGGDGTVELPSPGNGRYRAFFLANNEYNWLAVPVDVLTGYDTYDGNSFKLASTSPLSFKYSTSSPNSKNWIGLYFAAGGGPDRGTVDAPSIVWKYAGQSSGSVEIPTDGLLGDGSYRAYFLANDQYNSLAAPITFTIGDASKYPGALAIDSNQASFTFRYTTPDPNDQNWIGIYYASGGGPDNGQHNEDSITWDWAKLERGSVRIPSEKLSPGVYKAYFLAKNEYQSLAAPLVFTYTGGEGFQFIVSKFTTHNGRVGDQFKADVGQLVNLPGDSSTKFSITDQNSWASINNQGVITGTPRSAGDNVIHVQATNNGNTAKLEVRVPVRSSGSALVEELRVLSFNMWQGGGNVNNAFEKNIRFLANSNVDVVGLQESDGQANRLARALGWQAWQGSDVGIISRYPFDQVLSAPDRSGAVRINLDGSKSQIMFWNCHLGYTPYGPYDFCFDHLSYDQVMRNEAQSGRTPQIQAITAKMRDDIANADNVPVFLTGDFNAPSQLDWTNSNKHCGVGYVEWPTSKYPLDAGLKDSFRVAHPDPASVPGITWSPIYLDNNGRKEPLDRIDFVYHKSSKLSVQDSQAIVVGNPTPEPDQKDNDWTSDHRAVLTHYKLRN